MSLFESSNIPQSDLLLSFFDIKYIVRRRTDYQLNSAFPKPLHANTRLTIWYAKAIYLRKCFKAGFTPLPLLLHAGFLVYLNQLKMRLIQKKKRYLRKRNHGRRYGKARKGRGEDTLMETACPRRYGRGGCGCKHLTTCRVCHNMKFQR